VDDPVWPVVVEGREDQRIPRALSGVAARRFRIFRNALVDDLPPQLVHAEPEEHLGSAGELPGDRRELLDKSRMALRMRGYAFQKVGEQRLVLVDPDRDAGNLEYEVDLVDRPSAYLVTRRGSPVQRTFLPHRRIRRRGTPARPHPLPCLRTDDSARNGC